MAEAKPLASLTPTLLARKGGARPAIRTQGQDLTRADNLGEASEAAAENAAENAKEPAPRPRSLAGSKVVSLNTIRTAAPAGKPNALRRQRERLAAQLAGKPAPRRSEPAPRLAAFTVRLDAERHLSLRLASALDGRSAQQLVVEALDSMLASLPDVAEMAKRAGKRR